MSEKRPGRPEAMALLEEFTGQEALISHALSVEGVMRLMARKHGQDEEKWGIVGLVHDLDYERWPGEHCSKTGSILRERGWPEELVRAVLSHGWEICTDIEPGTLLEKTLYAVDELTGLVRACALVRPSGSLEDLKVKSVLKKWKDRRFAAGADRTVIMKGAQMLGVTLEELIADTIEGMREADARAAGKGAREDAG